MAAPQHRSRALRELRSHLPGRPLRYLFPRPVFQSVGLSIRGIGIHETMPPCCIERPKGTGDFLLMLFLDPVEVDRGKGWRRIPAGRLVIWGKNSPHYYRSALRTWRHSWIHCDGREVSKILKTVGLSPDCLVAPAHPIRIERYLLDLHEEIAGPGMPSPIVLRNIFENLVCEAARRGQRHRRPPVPDNLQFAREFIDTCYQQRVTLAGLAARAGLSIPHFCTEFRRHFGAPPVAYLISRRMRVAETLLRGTVAPVGEIGRQVGYDDPFYFSAHFKRFHGCPPSRLREN